MMQDAANYDETLFKVFVPALFHWRRRHHYILPITLCCSWTDDWAETPEKPPASAPTPKKKLRRLICKRLRDPWNKFINDYRVKITRGPSR